MYEVLYNRWNVYHSISETMLRNYVKAKAITPEQFEQITGFPYKKN